MLITENSKFLCSYVCLSFDWLWLPILVPLPKPHDLRYVPAWLILYSYQYVVRVNDNSVMTNE